jgi:hypothetical protein
LEKDIKEEKGLVAKVERVLDYTLDYERELG